jgi:hypothetical protein
MCVFTIPLKIDRSNLPFDSLASLLTRVHVCLQIPPSLLSTRSLHLMSSPVLLVKPARVERPSLASALRYFVRRQTQLAAMTFTLSVPFLWFVDLPHSTSPVLCS